MNYIDIVVIALVALGLLFGFIGKAPRKIFSFIFSSLSLVFAYIVSNKVTQMALSTSVKKIPMLSVEEDITISEFLVSKIKSVEVLEKLYNSTPSFKAIVDNAPGIIVFILLLFILGIVSLVLIPFVFNLIVKLFTRKAKKHTAWKTFGIFGALRGAMFSLVFLIPVIAFYPVIKDVDKIYDATKGENEKVAKILDTVSEQVSTSKILTLSDKLITENKLPFMVYSYGDKETYFYTDLCDVIKMVNAYGAMSDISDLSSLDPESIKDLFAVLEDSELAKDLVLGALDTIIDKEELGLPEDFFDDIDFKKEGEAIAVISEVLNAEDPSELSDEELSILANSDIVYALSSNFEGALENVDKETQDRIKNVLDDKLINDPDFDQERYDEMMKLFGSNE